MKSGLTSATIDKIRGIFARFPAIEKAVLYGSRAKGNFKTGSDIDLTLYGETLTPDLRTTIADALDDLLLPYTFDLSILDELDNANLREHIERVGLVFYERVAQGAAMKSGWEVKKLGDVCEVVNGGTPKTGVKEYWDGDFLWITPAEMGKRESPYASQTERKITDKGLKNSSAKLLPPKSVILSSRAPIGHLVINTEPMATNQGCKGLIPSKNMHYKYLFYYLGSKVESLNDLGSGATFKELSGGKLKEVPIPIAPLPEQKRIIAILDEVFEGIAKAKTNAEKNLQNARKLFESYLQSIFANPGEGWEVKKLGEVCEYDKTPHRKSTLPYVGLENIESNSGKFIGSLEPQKVKSLTFHFSGEHVLYGRLRPYLNKVLLPDFEGHCSTEIFPIKPNKCLNRRFLFHWLLSGETVKKINSTWTGARMPRANMNAVLEFKIPLPPLPEQKRIVAKLDELSAETKKLSAIYQQKLAALEELKKSVLHKAFAGGLA